MSRDHGVTEEKLLALSDFEGATVFSPLELASLRYAVKMTESPQEIPEEIFEDLRKQLNNEQIVELTAAIAWENFRARFNHALGVESAGFSEGAFCPIPERRLPAGHISPTPMP